MYKLSVALYIRGIENCTEVGGELLISIQRQNVSHILVWPHNHHAAQTPVNASHIEDVFAAS